MIQNTLHKFHCHYKTNMMKAINLTDGYKVDHGRQYPVGTELVYSNFTPRKSRNPEINQVVFFGLQYFIKKYLIEEYGKWFSQPEDVAVTQYKRRIDNYLGANHGITFDHIKALHHLGYLPVTIKAVKEGSLVPMRVAPLTITNTIPEFYWVVNYLETLLSCTLWGMCTSATTAHTYKTILSDWAMKTVGNTDFVKFQGHDFSFRGMFGVEAAQISGAAHLTSFVGTDTIPAIDFLEEYYDANSDNELIGCSVAATEHAVMCMGTGLYIYDKYNGDWSYQGEAEFAMFKRLLTEVYPSGIISVVSDTWNLWSVITDYLPRLKDIIMARDGKLVIRPDSGDPVDILCGDKTSGDIAISKGLIECLWDTFGGTVSDMGYKVLDGHVGAIYGDSITTERAKNICERLADKGFASINTVLGIGSYTYQYVTRDTFGWAMKATYGEVKTPDGRVLDIEIFKDPITDDGTKKSARGLLCINESENGLVMEDCRNWEQESAGALQIVFKNGELVRKTSLSEIRNVLEQASVQKVDQVLDVL